ncbi:MAG: archaellin/type IV pilin N-terminal domain-containing protein [Candidatus Nanoarchaeia archaeon]|jgi:flagellin-like protein
MNRKGITPVIAVVLLLMMTVAAAGAAFFWITTIQSRIQGQVGTQADQSAASAKQFSIISAICTHATPVQINVTLQNVGELTIDSGATAVTVTDAEANTISTNTSILSSNLDADQIIELTFYIGTNLTQNRTYGIKITVPGGAIQTSTCRAR